MLGAIQVANISKNPSILTDTGVFLVGHRELEPRTHWLRVSIYACCRYQQSCANLAGGFYGRKSLMRLSLLGCKTARAGNRVKGRRSPFILTHDVFFCPCYLRGEGPARKRPQGRAAAPEWGHSVGIGEPPQQAERQGVHRRALLAG